VAPNLLGTLLGSLQVFSPALTAPGYRNMLVVFAGWVLTRGTHAITQTLVETSVAGRVHHERFHRFFSRGTWNPDALAHLVFERILRLLPPDCPVWVAVDDTLAPKKGPHVFGIGTHIDAVRSTRKTRIFCFGHCWVVLAVIVPLPFSRRAWALPLLFRLYRSKKECAAKDAIYRKKTELARDMLDVLAGWVGQRRVNVTADSAYCNSTVTRYLPSNLVLYGSMRPDAVLTDLPVPRPGARGRPRIRGATLPKPRDIARDSNIPWQVCYAMLYGVFRTVRYKTIRAQWYRACGAQLLTIVIVKVNSGDIAFRVFLCMDTTATVEQILECYAGRWSIEVCFREMKQDLGFADSAARKAAAVERTAPFVGLIYTTLVLWFTEHARYNLLSAPPVRPWYPHKRGHSFADVLRTAQRVLGPHDILDLASGPGDLQKSRGHPATQHRRPTRPSG